MGTLGKNIVNVIKHTSFRSKGRLVNQSDDMVRVTVDMTKREWNRFRNQDNIEWPKYRYQKKTKADFIFKENI